MTSLIAWLDTSSEEQRRVRELIAVFAQSESRDELGIGQIRDAFSDTLFPGTSVIQTRARYFLFVPWIYRDGLRRGLDGARLKAWADTRERRLIETLRDAGEVTGLIGRRAGPAVKILPSTIYWSGMVRYGILTRDASADHLGAALNRFVSEADELDSRSADDWNATLPPAPAGFPDTVPDGFDMGAEEASWLSSGFSLPPRGHCSPTSSVKMSRLTPTARHRGRTPACSRRAGGVGAQLSTPSCSTSACTAPRCSTTCSSPSGTSGTGHTRVIEPRQGLSRAAGRLGRACGGGPHAVAKLGPQRDVAPVRRRRTRG